MITNDKTRWYALRVKSNREKLVAAGLECKAFESFLPLYQTQSKWSDRVKELERPLFSGYVFCRMDVANRLPALTVPGAIAFVGTGNTPEPVDDQEIATLQSIVRSGARLTAWPFLEVGQRVRIARGPLRDVEGIVTDLKGAMRLIVSVSILQRSVAVEIERDSITPAPRPVRRAARSGALVGASVSAETA